ncbi:hypothetical protein [Lichenihabitans psoromatis]|uniref:hypothetical protein n=1 Tax=Lichenihabitans psoromatis TaxID=2528642 RepID=UPI0010383295|nr:hypothetical protein [Lichenihabitans psoromatis]
MSLSQNFDHSSHPGFTRSIDPLSARRQLRVSLGVVAVLALAIGGSALAIRPTTGFDVSSQRASISDAAAVGHHNVNAAMKSGQPDRS